MPVRDGPSCPECGLPNYEGLCPHCRGDQAAYEDELVPPFESSLPEQEQAEALDEAKRDREAADDAQAKAEGLQRPPRMGGD